jgi:tRNA (adenine57-N1/adenine58-N1)-methyltransferase
MYETLLRPIEVFQIPPLPNIAVVSEKIKISEQKREEKRLRQIAANKAAAASGAGGSSVNAKRKREDAAEDLDEDEDDEMSAVEGLIASKKKLRTTDIGEDEEEDTMEDASPLPEEPGHADTEVLKTEGSDPSPQPATTASHQAPKNASSLIHPSAKINVSKALPEVRGHTSYLTFACLIPIPASAVSQEDTKTKAMVNP